MLKIMYIKPHGVVIVHYCICRSMLRQRMFFSPAASLPIPERAEETVRSSLFPL